MATLQRKKMIRGIILVILLINVCSYSIQGNWTLTAARYIDLGNQSIVLSISDYIFKGQSIFQKLIFSGCQNMLLQAQFTDDQLFINGKSYYRQPIGNITCNSSNDVLNKIYSVLNSVFFFEINIDTLMFNDAYGNSVFSFKRIISKTPANITGIWNMNQYGNTQTSLSVQISNTQITLCQGNLVLGYTLATSQNIISLTTVTSSCPSQELTNALLASKYFRLKNGILNLYDSKVALTVGLVYSSVFDPSKPIFGSQAASSTSNSSLTSSSNLPISVSNLAASWSIISLFGVPFPSSPYTLVFSPSMIVLSGGCSNYNFSYTLNTTTQIITLGSLAASVSAACSKSDDQLYISGISKMYKYLISSTNGAYTLNFYDQTGNIGYSLRSGASQSQSAQKPAQTSSTTLTPTPTPLSAGTYLLLLLSRRDLPRVLVNITSNIITYKSCNNIQHTFTPARLTSNSGSISFSGGPTTNNTCTINNDQVYFGTVNSAKSYKFDPSAGALILSNDAGVQIGTLSNAS